MNKPQKHTRVLDVNVILDSPHVQEGDHEVIFQEEPVIHLPASSSLVDILVASGISKSKGQARKTAHLSWVDADGSMTDKQPVREYTLPTGYSEFQSGKLKHWVYIWNPSE